MARADWSARNVVKVSSGGRMTKLPGPHIVPPVPHYHIPSYRTLLSLPSVFVLRDNGEWQQQPAA